MSYVVKLIETIRKMVATKDLWEGKRVVLQRVKSLCFAILKGSGALFHINMNILNTNELYT